MSSVSDAARAPARAVVIAAPASGSGKTTLTLALLRHLRETGTRVASLKVGPDYIDPAFHHVASGRPCLNLDPWAMRSATLEAVLDAASQGADIVLVEGVMGLFDGATASAGSTAGVAAALALPVVLVVDAGAMAASAAAVVQGFAGFRAGVKVAGVVYNRVGSARHAELLVEATASIGVPVLGCVQRDPALALPDRHLGLVQAREHPDLEPFLERAARIVGAAVEVEALLALARAPTPMVMDAPRHFVSDAPPPLPPLGQRIAVAHDDAFAFAYPLTLEGWRRAGAELLFFSPLADEPPAESADAVYLAGGYPELHAGTLAAATRFRDGLRASARRGAAIFGECGGYMALGEYLVDADGEAHEMAGLVPLTTTFAERGLTLGYRTARTVADSPLGPAGTRFRGHEFHYAKIVREGRGDDIEPLFQCGDARGRDLGAHGARVGNVAGSFVHLIDRED